MQMTMQAWCKRLIPKMSSRGAGLFEARDVGVA